jgi:hypothetical protein
MHVMRFSRSVLYLGACAIALATAFAPAAQAQRAPGKLTLLALPVQLDLKNSGFVLPGDSALGPLATGQLLASLAHEPAFTLADPAAVRAVLDSIAARAEPCTDDRCALAVARRVGAVRVLAVKVTKFSSLLWFVDTRLLDVSTGKPLQQDSFKLDGVADQIVPAAMISIARRVGAGAR